MGEYQYKYQSLFELVEQLPEGVSRAKYILAFQAAVREGVITAVPLGDKFKVGGLTYKNDMVRVGSEFEKWHQRTLRAFELGKARRGVVAHADDVRSGAVDFDELAAKYRQQLVGRAGVKRPKTPKRKGKPKLTPISADDPLATQPIPAGGDMAERQGAGSGAGQGASASAGDGE